MRRLAVPVIAALVALLLWDTPLVTPLKIFVVFLHELSHGLAAVLTGGSIVRIEITPDQGGLCVTRGGWRFLVLSAGYLGSLSLGALLLVAAARWRRDRLLVALVGLVTLGVTLLYVRSSFGFVYGIAAGACLIVASRKLSEGVCDGILKVIGVVSCLYAVWDIASDTLFRSLAQSDASALGRITGIPGAVWGAFWIGTAVVVTVLALRSAARSRG